MKIQPKQALRWRHTNRSLQGAFSTPSPKHTLKSQPNVTLQARRPRAPPGLPSRCFHRLQLFSQTGILPTTPQVAMHRSVPHLLETSLIVQGPDASQFCVRHCYRSTGPRTSALILSLPRCHSMWPAYFPSVTNSFDPSPPTCPGRAMVPYEGAHGPSELLDPCSAPTDLDLGRGPVSAFVEFRGKPDCWLPCLSGCFVGRTLQSDVWC